VKRLQSLITEIGLDAERVHMFQLSSAQAGEFVHIAEKMTDQIEKLGPNPFTIRPAGQHSRPDQV
jgi:F420-non-reducing hydrogenase iron-sulfur subunit